MSNPVVCDECGHQMKIGEWPFCPHEPSPSHHPFIPYWDEHVSEKGAWVTSLAQRWRLMKENKLDYRGVKVGHPRCEV